MCDAFDSLYLKELDFKFKNIKEHPGTVSLEDAMRDESLLERFVDDHSGPFPYAYWKDDDDDYDDLYHSGIPGPCFWTTASQVREYFYAEKARRRKEKIMAICSILKQVYERKVKEK